ncbi:hypothetical protein [Larkinella soli]|uniref:hypothetical protein n=1 Tax=Larkinella soli TaxID=1770527 RepID=UPI0013E3EE4C|nr:hypothetical protein [Larkinella soli]
MFSANQLIVTAMLTVTVSMAGGQSLSTPKAKTRNYKGASPTRKREPPGPNG